MSLYKRRSLLCLPLALAACGFSPVYGTGGNGTRLQDNLSIDAPSSENAFLVTQRIEERLGRAINGEYRLALTIQSSEESLAIDSQGDIDRFNILGSAEYTLINVTAGGVVASGSVDNFTSYSASGTTVATFAAERDARRRLMSLLADQVIVRLFTADLV